MRMNGATFDRYILCGLLDHLPDVVQVTSAGCERRHAIQTTLYRQPGESDAKAAAPNPPMDPPVSTTLSKSLKNPRVFRSVKA